MGIMKRSSEPRKRRPHKERRKAEIRAAWQSLIDDGTLVPSGEYRRNSKGELEPVYVHRDLAKRH